MRRRDFFKGLEEEPAPKKTDFQPGMFTPLSIWRRQASQNQLADFLAERATEILKPSKPISKQIARRLLEKLATIEPARLIRVEEGRRISYRVTELDESQKPKNEGEEA